MSAFSKLIRIYQEEGYRVWGGYNPSHYFGLEPVHTAFMNLHQGEQKISTGGGVSPFEMMLLEDLCSAINPQRILIIGNAWGWSTLGMALAASAAKVVAIDLCGDEGAKLGLTITNDLALKHGLNAKAVQGESPQCIESVIKNYMDDNPVDLFLIDGNHKNEAIAKDFIECAKFATENSVFLFHDVINWNMHAGFELIQTHTKMAGGLLYRTTSGMGMLYREHVRDLVDPLFHAYAGDAADVAALAARAKLIKGSMSSFILGV